MCILIKFNRVLKKFKVNTGMLVIYFNKSSKLISKGYLSLPLQTAHINVFNRQDISCWCIPKLFTTTRMTHMTISSSASTMVKICLGLGTQTPWLWLGKNGDHVLEKATCYFSCLKSALTFQYVTKTIIFLKP